MTTFNVQIGEKNISNDYSWTKPYHLEDTLTIEHKIS